MDTTASPSTMNVPNVLTLARILLIPIFVVVFYLPFDWSHVASAFIFALACLTDWFDGFLARYLGQTSTLGEFLDPVADKLVVAVALVLLVGEKSMPYLAAPAAVIVGREIVISALREWMSEMGKRTSIAVTIMAKFKTAIQMVALILLLAYTPGSNDLIGWIGYILMFIAAGMTLWSMIVYLKIAWPELVGE